MNTWQQWLTQHPTIAEKKLGAGLNDTQVCPLPEWAVLSVSGADAVPFLQGQTTNDVRQVHAQHFQLNSLCAANGRIISNFWLAYRDDKLLIILPSTLRAKVHEHLRKYVLRSAVTLALGDEVCLGIAGPQAENIVQTRLGKLEQIAQVDNITMLRMPFTLPAFLLLGPVEALGDCLLSWVKSCALTDYQSWDVLHILAGITQIVPATLQAFTPQMINFPQLGGVSFTKGCYTGQEVIARTHYLGKVKRHVYPARSCGDAAIGDTVQDSAGQPVGEVAFRAPWPEGGVGLLLLLQDQAVAQGNLRLNGQEISLLPLPYSLEMP